MGRKLVEKNSGQSHEPRECRQETQTVIFLEPHWGLICYWSCSVTQFCQTLRPHGLQHARLLCPLPSPRVCSSSSPLSKWCYLTILSSVTSFSFCFQSFPSTVFSNDSTLHSKSLSIGAFAVATVLPMNIQHWFPLGLTGLISLQSKGLSRVFSNTTVQRH